MNGNGGDMEATPQQARRRTAGSARDIRAAHRRAVLREIYTARAPTRRDLAVRTGVSVATASNIVAELLRAGVVRESAYEDSEGGRPRARITVNARRGALVGVEVRAASVHIDVYDLALDPRTTLVVPATSWRDVADAVSTAVADAGIDAHHVLGVGIAAPASPRGMDAAAPAGPRGMDAAAPAGPRGADLAAPAWLRGPPAWLRGPPAWLRGAPLDPAVLPAPVRVSEPATAAAVAELWLGPNRRATNLVSVTLGDSAGAVIAVGGAPLQGGAGMAGGWGHTTVVHDGRLCWCGRRGCAEAYLGAPGILRSVRELTADSRLARDTPDATVHALGRAMRDGDPAAAAVIGATARHLGVGVARLVNVIDPDAVALNGWVVDALGRWLVPAAREAASGQPHRRRSCAVPIEVSPGPRNAVTVGAAAAAHIMIKASLK
ncbi:ROK family transcriptional regulator [Actinomycetes bacterium KLBMP 9797]